MSRYTYNRIKELLARKGKKNVELAKYIGVDPRTVSGWCRNINQPEYKTLFEISNFLEIEASELLTPKKELRLVEDSKDHLRKVPKNKSTAKKRQGR